MKYKNFLKSKSGLFRKIIASSLSLVFGTGVFSNCAVVATEKIELPQSLSESALKLKAERLIYDTKEELNRKEKNNEKEEGAISLKGKGKKELIIRNKKSDSEEESEESNGGNSDFLEKVNKIGGINFGEDFVKEDESGGVIIIENLFEGSSISAQNTTRKRKNGQKVRKKGEKNLIEKKKQRISKYSGEADIEDLAGEKTKFEKFIESIKYDRNLKGWIILFIIAIFFAAIFLTVYIKSKNKNAKDSGVQNIKDQENENTNLDEQDEKNRAGEEGDQASRVNSNQGQENSNSSYPLMFLKTSGKLAASGSTVAAITYGTNKIVSRANRKSRKTQEKSNGENNGNENKFNLANEDLSNRENKEDKSTGSAKSA